MPMELIGRSKLSKAELGPDRKLRKDFSSVVIIIIIIVKE